MMKNTLWMFLGQGLRVVIQAVYFVLIARILGVEGYGMFMGVVSLVAVLAPFSSWGTGNLMIMNVARDRSTFAENWGRALVMTVLTGCLLTVLTYFISGQLLPAGSSQLVITIALSDFVLLRLLEISSHAFQAFDRLKRTAQLQTLLSFTRLLGAVYLLLLAGSKSAQDWAVIYLCATAVSALIGVWLVTKELGRPQPKWSRLLEGWKDGFYFSISSASVALYSDTNKILLVKLSTLDASGIFAAASRLIDVALTPIRALMSAMYASFFKEGKDGINGSLQLAKRYLPFSSLYGIVAGLLLFLFAPVVPHILGDEYGNAVEAIRWLSVIPVIKSVNSLIQDTLTGSGFQGVRSGIQMTVALLNVAMNYLLIPLYSWKGAAMASILSDLLLTVGYWIAIQYLQQRQVQRAASGN